MIALASLLPAQVDAPDFQSPYIDWWSLTPLLILLGTGIIVLVGGALAPKGWRRGLYAAFTVAGGLASIVTMCFLWDDVLDEGPKTLVAGELVLDGLGLFLAITIVVALILATLVTDAYLRREELDGPEVYGLYLMTAVGGIVMASANDMVVLFLGLETLSISLYVLAASHRKRIESQEAGIKYFVLGGFSSAFFLYGIALVYGATGSTNFNKILASFDAVPVDRNDALVLVGLALLLVGLAFKVTAVPFHWW